MTATDMIPLVHASLGERELAAVADVVDDDRGGPPFALLFAAEMLVKSRQGGTWRRADYHDWLTKAGFEDVSFRATPSPATLVLAR